VNSRHSIRNALPVSGLCAFVRVAAMSLVGVDCRDPHAQHLLALKRPLEDRQEQGQMYPGEGGA
jgi:hypothetical protein